MNLRELSITKRREDQRVHLISELLRRQDELLRARKPDLEAIERLADECDAAGLHIVAAGLASRLAWLRVASFLSEDQPEQARD